MNLKYLSIASAITFALMGCQKQEAKTGKEAEKTQTAEQTETNSQTYQPISTDRFGIYTDFTLTADLSHLSANQKEMIAHLVNSNGDINVKLIAIIRSLELGHYELAKVLIKDHIVHNKSLDFLITF